MGNHWFIIGELMGFHGIFFGFHSDEWEFQQQQQQQQQQQGN